MPTRLADRLSAVRQRRFVGRQAEQALLRSALTAAELPFLFVYIHGPGGVGKTTLLRHFALLSTELQIAAIYIDARDVRPTPDSFIQTLKHALSFAPAEPPIEMLAAHAERQVLLIDSFEALAALDDWLRESFLPQLPDNLPLVLSARTPPPTV